MDSFASLGTSNIFFQIVLGRTAPNDIASHLKIKPPGVVEHLRRLQGMGVVEIGHKEGKYQNYKINWAKFVEVFFEHIYTSRILKVFIGMEDNVAAKKLTAEQVALNQVIAELKRSENFKDLVRIYFEVLAMNMGRGLYPLRTIWSSIYCFEDSLASVPSILERARNPEMRKLLKLLEKWNLSAQQFKLHGPQAAFDSAIESAFKHVEAQ